MLYSHEFTSYVERIKSNIFCELRVDKLRETVAI